MRGTQPTEVRTRARRGKVITEGPKRRLNPSQPKKEENSSLKVGKSKNFFLELRLWLQRERGVCPVHGSPQSQGQEGNGNAG